MKIFKQIICILLISSSFNAFTQEKLNIDEIFSRFGKRKGSTLTFAYKTEINGIQTHNYKSLVMTYNEKEMLSIQNCLNQDKEFSSKIKEVISDGIIVNGYYYFKPVHKSQYNRFILFNILPDKECVLIYMESKISSDEMIKLLK